MTTSCKCILDSYCKTCFYRNPQTIPPFDYEYWNSTIWLEQMTVNGWGAFNGGSSNNGNSTLYDNKKIPDIVKNANINLENVNFQHIIKVLDEYEADSEIQVDIDSLSNFILENNKELNSWSVVLVQKPGTAKKLLDINWQMKFYNKNNIIELQDVTGISRKWEEKETSKTKTISSLFN